MPTATTSRIKFVPGDLIAMAKNGEFDVIIHGCNCFCSMAGGCAAQIAKELPEAAIEDHGTIQGDLTKMGTYTEATVMGVKQFTVINAYTQYFPGFQADFDYNSLIKVLKAVVRDFNGQRIGLPWIGCGIAGASKQIVEAIIEETMMYQDVTIVEFVPPTSQDTGL